MKRKSWDQHCWAFWNLEQTQKPSNVGVAQFWPILLWEIRKKRCQLSTTPTPDSMLMPKLDVQTTSYGLFGRTFTFRKRASFKYNHLSITFPEYETPPRNLFVWNLNISGCLILEGWDYKHVYIYTYIYMYIYIYIYIYIRLWVKTLAPQVPKNSCLMDVYS